MIRKTAAVVVAFSLAVSFVLALADPAPAAYKWTSTGGPGAGEGTGAICAAFDSRNHVIYTGTVDGHVWRLAQSTGAWHDMGAVDTGTVFALLYEGGILYAGTGIGNVWRNVDPRKNDTWTNTGAQWEDGAYCLVHDGANLYASSGTNVYRNPNPRAGNTWQDVGAPNGLFVLSLHLLGSNLYAGTSSGEVLRNPGPATGSTWSSAGNPDESRPFAFADDGTNLYAGTHDGGVFRNTNPASGTSWQEMGNPGGIDIAWAGLSYDGRNDVLYAFSHEEARVSKNLNPSASNAWSDLGQILPVSRWYYYAAALFCDPDGNFLYAGQAVDEGSEYTGSLFRSRIPAVASVRPAGAAAGSTLDVTITGSATRFADPVRAHFSGEGIKVNSTRRVSYAEVVANVTLAGDAPLEARDAWVTYGTGRCADKTNRKVAAFKVNSPNSTWYLAEGTTAWGYSTYITIENPCGEPLTARITYMDPATEAGGGRMLPPRDVPLAPLSQTTVDPRWDLGDTDFCARVECLEGEAIAVDRTMSWTGEGASAPEAHNSIGVNAPSVTWYLPEGSSDHGFETWTLIENPNDTEAEVMLTYMTENDGPKVLEKRIAALSRASYSMERDIGGADASIEVDSNVPVVAERSMYRNNRREGSCSVGTNAPANNFYLAEGTTAYGFTTYLLIQNPNDVPVQVVVFYLTPEGPVQEEPFEMPANSRKTIRVNDVAGLADTDTSIQVYSPKGIIAERAMYWDNGAGEAMHASIRLDLPHRAFYLPDGQTSGGWQTYTLVQNPGEMDLDIRITYLPQDGSEAEAVVDVVPANSRRTYSMADRVAGGRAGALVEVTTPYGNVMVERSMYCNGRATGTNTIGAHSD